MRIVITGSSGFVGGELARRFKATGHTVTGLSRTSPSNGKPDNFIQSHLGHPAPNDAFTGADLVVHGAYNLSQGSSNLNINGTKMWFSQAKREGISRQILLSTYSANKESPSEYGRSKHAIEEHFLNNGELVIRLGWVIGSGGSFARTMAFVKKLPVVPIPGGDIKIAITGLDELAEAILKYKLMAGRRAYNIFQPELISLIDISKKVRQREGIKWGAVSFPLKLFKVSISLAQKIGMGLPMSYESFLALEKSQDYNYPSSYGELGLRSKSLPELLETA